MNLTNQSILNIKNNDKPQGIVNKCNLCWLNSFIQILYHIPVFYNVCRKTCYDIYLFSSL
jgi:ubiquitin C-terminal hydrolase